MLSEVIGARASHLMEVNAHKVSPKEIGAVQKETRAIATSAIALGEGWLSLDVSNPVICRHMFNVVFLFGIVAVEISTATLELIGTVPLKVIPAGFINVSEAAIKAD